MHSPSKVGDVLARRDAGFGARRISKQTGIPVATVRDWLAGNTPKRFGARESDDPACNACGQAQHRFGDLPPEYVYLLGLYLGDGCISAHRRGVFRLRIFLDLRYPVIIEDCVAAVSAVVPHNRVHQLARWSNYAERYTPSNVEVSAFSKCWPCLFPQHGPGRKHERSILLSQWQLALVSRWPGQLLRGLIHSDGCRFRNTGRNGWSWPRYTFRNKSGDIRAIFCDACDELGVHWTVSGDETLYVSRKADVALMDQFIGPKR